MFLLQGPVKYNLVKSLCEELLLLIVDTKFKLGHKEDNLIFEGLASLRILLEWATLPNLLWITCELSTTAQPQSSDNLSLCQLLQSQKNIPRTKSPYYFQSIQFFLVVLVMDFHKETVIESDENIK